MDDSQSGDYFDLGAQFGKVYMKQVNKKRVAEMMQGIVKAFGGNFNLEALLECIGDEDKAALELDGAFNEFKSAVDNKSIEDAIAAVILTVAGVKQATAGFPTCQAVDTSKWNYAGL